MHTFTYTASLYPFNLISFCFFRLYLLYLALYVGCICTLAVSLFLLLSSVVGRPSSSAGRRRHLVFVCMCEKFNIKAIAQEYHSAHASGTSAIHRKPPTQIDARARIEIQPKSCRLVADAIFHASNQ